ncbi:8-amino-7-oxononanoate synthase [Chitinimonas koreensis]|uniref:8-amino-7-oxononanoate synthase n=1 Tax=Chitinimonas koreensis TaxID=356302 RepID=UPI00048C22B4|nr:8-amino-7-oxononanoate synthase [Chitinimonas koreensis]QNM97252.1 8-amino-7-oxononanoate synthase [Chitinimonas koreensis]
MQTDFSLLAELEHGLAELDDRQLRRRRRVVDSPQGPHVEVDGRPYLNFCGNDYLGLAADPRLKAAAVAAIDRYGVGSGASHLVCGHQSPHQALEDRFAAFVGRPAALLFSTGYMANLGVVTALVGRGDAVFADKLNHASLNDACQLSRADFERFGHNDLAALERRLAASTARRKLIAIDAVYSMDGDLAPVAELLALAERYDAWLYLDDAHGFGVLGEGRGSAAHAGIASPRLIYLATLGKAAGSAGALVAAEAAVIDWLLNKAGTAIYTTAAPAAIAAATLAALDAIEHEPWRRERLAQHVERLRAGLAGSRYRLAPSQTPIQPILLDDAGQALALSQALFERGLWVAAIRPPTVATARLRVTLSALHADAEIDRLVATLLELQ